MALAVDFSASSSYKINSLEVRMTDVQKDFDKYWGYYLATNNKPQIVKEEGEVVLSFEGKEAGKDYYDEKGNILPEYDYSKGPGEIKEIKDLLVFDNDLFKKSLAKDPSRTEMGICFKNGATGSNLQLENPGDLCRIDIVVASADICDLSVIDSLFGWPGNDCLSASVKSTLQDMKPIGKPIYSYFVRIY